MSSTDALFTLHTSQDDDGVHRDGTLGSAVTGVCFVRDPNPQFSGIDTNNSESDSDDDASSSSPLQFQCSNLLLGPNKRSNSDPQQHHSPTTNAQHISASSHNFLSGGILAACHFDGSCKLWDLASRRCIVKDIISDDMRSGGRLGSGLSVRRVQDNNSAMHRFLYQTRDPYGTVSLHDLQRPDNPILQMQTYSSSFCAMAPCSVVGQGMSIGGEQNLVALPTEDHSVAVVRDMRCNPSSNPAYRISIGGDNVQGFHGGRNKYGMLTSLALSLQESSQRMVLGCGMENGSAVFYDLSGDRSCINPWKVDSDSRFMCSAKLGKDPVLCLDLASSSSTKRHGDGHNERNLRVPSLVAVGGCAGDAEEASELPEQDQGTVSVIKVKLAGDAQQPNPQSAVCTTMKASIRSKTQTCSLSSGGKIGVSTIRFRSDGRIFAVGGWDKRLRLFDRASTIPLAILHGHEDSVVAVDWSENAAVSGLVATGASDGCICVYRVFPHSSKGDGKQET